MLLLKDTKNVGGHRAKINIIKIYLNSGTKQLQAQ